MASISHGQSKGVYDLCAKQYSMQLYANVLGEGPEDLIIMHGLFGMSDNWQTLGKKWAEHYTVHMLDMRNHGRSPHSNHFSYELMSEDLLEYLNSKDIAAAHILGHSMGGKVAMLYSVLNPERCLSLIVADIAPKPYEPHHQEVIAALEGLDLASIESRREAQEIFGPELEPGVRQFLLKSLYWEEKTKLNWRFNLPVIAREIQKVGEGLAANAYFDKPTLFLRGGDSWYIQDEDLYEIESHFPQAELITIPKAGHWLHAQQPQAFFETVTDFLSRQ